MSTDVGVGDAELPHLDVTPAHGDTVAVLTVYPPGADSFTVPTSGGDLEEVPGTTPTEYTQRWTATEPVIYTAPGRWVLHWAVTGTGEGAEPYEVYVVEPPTAGGPTWTPGRSRVANYLPHRTLVRDIATTIGSQDRLLMSWDSTTTPTGVQVDRLIADGVAYVSSRLSPVHATSEAAAAVLACLYCAAMIERSWPHDDQSLQRANDLERRLDLMLADLAEANNAANGTDDHGLEIAPAYWSFPAADARYDDAGYW